MNEITQFKATALAERIEAAKAEIVRLYKTNGYDDAAEKLSNEINLLGDDRKIRVVVIGQYTAGKSTIISALTGNAEIKISADIATSNTHDYEWGGVLLTDTPGLYTENPEHDAISLDMIRKSDLLIYCITSDLFNQYTMQDFCKWAFTEGYAGKMFLLINKMSKEDGEFDILKKNYELTINKDLSPHTIGEFPCSFVDAKDYRDGIADNDRELVEFSHFEDFILQLNEFIAQKGYLGKLDAPIMVLKASIDEMMQVLSDDDKDRAYLSVLSRIEQKVDQQRNQISIEAHNIIRRGLRNITDFGYDLSRKVGVEKIKCTDNDIEELISNTCQSINSELDILCSRGIEDLNEEVEEVLQSETATYFFNSISSAYTEKATLFEGREKKINRAQFDSIKGIVETISGQTIAMASKTGTATNIFFKASDVADSPMHTAIVAIGKQFGYKFKPWEAVNIAKNIGNIAKAVGPILTVIGLALDVKETADEIERDERIRKEQMKTRQMFVDIVSDLEKQYSAELSRLFLTYDGISKQLSDSRSNVQKIVKSSTAMNDRLFEIKEDLVSIQTSIF